MIPRSGPVKVLALGFSVAAVGGAMAVGLAPDPVEIAGGGAPVETRFGTSFEDLAVGTLSSEAPAETVAPVTPQPAPPVEARPVEPVTPAPAPDPVRREVPTVAVRDAAPASEPAPDPVAPAETVTGEAPEPGVVTASRRPPTRSERFEAENAAPDPAPARRTARGNADRAARAGAETGRRDAPARAEATGRGAAQQAGNAAASNYPGAVMARLSRVPRPTVRARGAATVAFAVDSGGGLARASVARSSGSVELDRAALRLVRRAAPFPAPPRGAQRTFSIRIAGR